jgi:RNA polymerase sigma-70 factor, ECF subfamily
MTDHRCREPELANPLLAAPHTYGGPDTDRSPPAVKDGRRPRGWGMDQDLVVRVQQGDQRAFEALAVTDYPRLYRVAYGVMGDHPSAEDVTQQALLGIWRDIRRPRDPARYEAWAYRLLVRVCYAEAKRQPGWMSNDHLSPADEPRATDPYGAVADRDQLERGLQRLSMDHRVVLALRHLLGMTPDEVAAPLGISRWAVYSRLARATEAMRAALTADARSVTAATEPQEVLR